MATLKRTIKIYHANNIQGYSNWITNREIVDNIEEADVLFLEGGSDFGSKYYGEPESKHTYSSDSSDKREIAAFNDAVRLGIPIIGTCKGLQVIVALQKGGKLIQHQSHPGRHDITTIDGLKLSVNSLHHQAVYPYNMEKGSYEVLCWAEGLSPFHLGGRDEEMSTVEGFQEIEGLFIPKIKALGFQFHGEMMWRNNPNDPLFEWLYKQMKDKLGLEVE